MDILKNPRNGCELQGALQTIEAIRGAVPIIHANAGCAAQNYLADRAGGLGVGYISGFSVPCTNLQERHIVFGGASRLREQIKNTVKVIQGDLYIVLGGCAASMIGDDIQSMAREAAAQGYPVIACQTTGFHGENHSGYEIVMTDILKNLQVISGEKREKDPLLVNIFGILPERDVFYRGDLEEIVRILTGIGLKANTFFGPAEGTKEFARASEASLNLVFSKWGNKPADVLKELHGIPCLEYPFFPMGTEGVKELIKDIGKRIPLDEEKAAAFLEREEKRFQYYMKGILEDIYSESAGMRAAVVGDAGSVLRVKEFLIKYLDMLPEILIITDKAEEKEEQPEKEKIYYTRDLGRIENILRESKVEILFGSSLEDEIAEELEIGNLPVSYPVYDKCILDKTYAGIQGALRFTEDFMTKCKEKKRQRENILTEKLWTD